MRPAFPLSCPAGLALAFALAPPAAAQTLFLEDFQTVIDPGSGQPVVRCAPLEAVGTFPFPTGWALRNVDNRVPASSVSYVNDAWEVREDFGEDSNNCVAFSTSWYTPAGTANDWMWTPLIGPIPAGSTVLSWRAKNYDPAYPDGYEVRIMVAPTAPTGGTGVIGNQLTNSTLVFSIAAEAAAWTARSVALDAYAGQSLYIGFRNNSTDKFLLVVDDVKVEHLVLFDPALLGVSDTPTRGYAKLPAPLAYPFQLQADVRNAGSNALTGVVVAADLLVDGAPVGALTSSPVASLAPGATQTVAVGSAAYDRIGAWSVEALVSAAEGDGNLANSTLARDLTEVTADQLTRAQGPATGVLGIGAENGGEIGQDFALPVDAKLHAVRISMNNSDDLPAGDPAGDGLGDFNGFALELRVRSWNDIANEPGTLLATATAVVPLDAPTGPLALEFDFEGRVLPAGRYLMALAEPVLPEPRTLTLHTMLERYTPGTSWVNWPTSPLGGWANLEEFGASFQRAVGVTAVLGLPVRLPTAQDDSYTLPQSGTFAGNVALNDTPSDDGGNVWTVTSPPASGELVMQPSGAFAYTPAPGAAGSTVTFTYSLCDAGQDCDTATVELQVQVNIPRAQNDSFTVPSTGVFAGNVALNDRASDDGGNVWAVASPPASGLLVMQPSGAFEYTPAPGASGTTATFTYSLCDQDMDCGAASVALRIQVNVPTARDDAFTVAPEAVFAGNVSLNDTPSDDGGNAWTVTAPPASGLLVMQPTGAFQYTPAAAAAGSALTFEYSLCDLHSDCDTASVQLQVQPFDIFADSFESAP